MCIYCAQHKKPTCNQFDFNIKSSLHHDVNYTKFLNASFPIVIMWVKIFAFKIYV